MLLDLKFENLVVSKKLGFRKGRKEILHGISGRFRPGQLVALLGPSGAGKTTLLNVLSGFDMGGAKGTILINEKGRNMRDFKRTSCYITQENDLNERLSVEENMKFAADLKLGRNRNGEEKAKIIQNILTMLGLETTVKTRASQLSGGQLKRLSVALELISDPMIMFLDEPTTGLDSFASRQLIDYLKSLSTKGKTIICTIHQPSATLFKNFDIVYLLASGRCLYHGGPGELLGVLEDVGAPCPVYHNPADHIIEIASGELGADKIEKLSSLCDNGKIVLSSSSDSSIRSSFYESEEENTRRITKSYFYELWTLIKRETIKTSRNISLLHLRIFASVAISICLSSVYWKLGDDASKVWFNYNMIQAFILSNIIGGLMLTVLVFPFEFKVLKKEHFNGYYSIWNYFIAITFVDLPLSIICSAILSFSIYCTTGQPLEINRITIFYTTSFLISVIAQSLGLFIGTVFDIKNGIFIGSYIHFPFMLVSGFSLNLIDLPAHFYWASYLSYLKYGLSNMLGAIYRFGRKNLKCPEDEYCLYSDGAKFLNDVGIDGTELGFNFGMLGLFYVGLRTAALLAMRCKLS